MNSILPFAHSRLNRWPFLLLLSTACLTPALIAAKADKTNPLNANGDLIADATAPKATKRDEKAMAKAARANNEDPNSRQQARLRDRLGVTDDAEWAVIAERIAKVEELRRTVALVATGGRGIAAQGDKGKGNARQAGSTHPEYDALRAAVGDQYPDAEIKDRLARTREAYQKQEAQLLKAQADLRAVFTIRQEAVAVMAGLLPP